jgi:hypothetical protein
VRVMFWWKIFIVMTVNRNQIFCVVYHVI